MPTAPYAFAMQSKGFSQDDTIVTDPDNVFDVIIFSLFTGTFYFLYSNHLASTAEGYFMVLVTVLVIQHSWTRMHLIHTDIKMVLLLVFLHAFV